jgi:hypothetical protein
MVHHGQLLAVSMRVHKNGTVEILDDDPMGLTDLECNPSFHHDAARTPQTCSASINRGASRCRERRSAHFGKSLLRI